MSDTQRSDGTSTKYRGQGLGHDVEALKADVVHAAHSAADVARSGVVEVRQQATHVIDAAKDKYEDAREAAAKAARSAKGLVERNPVASVGIAVGVGVGLGLLLAIAAGRVRR